MAKRKTINPLFEKLLFIEWFKRDGGEVNIYFKDFFFVFYFYIKWKDTNQVWNCIGKIKIKDINSDYKEAFYNDERCIAFRDFLKWYKWNLSDKEAPKNISFPEYRRYLSELQEGKIKNIEEFKEIESFLNWKIFKDII